MCSSERVIKNSIYLEKRIISKHRRKLHIIIGDKRIGIGIGKSFSVRINPGNKIFACTRCSLQNDALSRRNAFNRRIVWNGFIVSSHTIFITVILNCYTKAFTRINQTKVA